MPRSVVLSDKPDTTASDGGAVPISSHTPGTWEQRVTAAIDAGAPSWTAVARQLGCSRAWATQVGRRAGIAPANQEPREAVLSVRVRADAKAYLAKLADEGGVSVSEMARRLLARAVADELNR